MVRAIFKEWIQGNFGEFQRLSISIEFVKHKITDKSLIPDPSTDIIQETDKSLGQVTVWESRQMEFEVVNIESEEMTL